MATYSTADIRNVLLVGHAGSGKTSLADALLFEAKAVTHRGDVSQGTSFSDFEKDEKEHHLSIHSAVLHCERSGKRINLIDAPGSPDLIGAAIACFPAVETVAVVISAKTGIGAVTQRMMDAARERDLPRVIVINQIDSEPTGLGKLVETLRETFGPECLPINLPGKSGGVVDCLLDSSGESSIDSVKRYHAAILDQIVEMDDQLMEKYLGGEEPDYDALHAPFEAALDAGHVIPILFVDSQTGRGVRELLDAVALHFPSPLEGNRRPFLSTTAAGHEIDFHYTNDPVKPLLAHVFKITTDPFAGKLAIFRVHQGECTGQSQVFLGHNKKPVKLGHLFQLQGKEHAEVKQIIAGDIGAVGKLEEVHIGDVLHEDHALDSVHLRPLAFPSPMHALALVPHQPGDEQKISTQLAKLAEEDPTFRWTVDRQTRELVVHGLGEMHLKLVLERLAARGLALETKPPQIAYRETITDEAEGHHRHKKQSGGSGQFGEVFLRVAPLEESNPLHTARGGPGFEFSNELFGGAIPGQFVPAIENGVREVIEHGVIAGFPVQNVRVTLYDGKHHAVDSKEIAFKTAGKRAFIDAFKKASPTLLEPIVTLDLTVPQDKLGAITADLSTRHGRIHATDTLPGALARIRAEAPLSSVQSYPSRFKSLTAGRGTFVMDLARYEPVTPALQQQVTSAFKPHVEEEA